MIYDINDIIYSATLRPPNVVFAEPYLQIEFPGLN